MKRAKSEGWAHSLGVMGSDRFEKKVGDLRIRVSRYENVYAKNIPGFQDQGCSTLGDALDYAKAFEEEYGES